MKPLDKKDLIILSELLLNSRISYSELAEKLKLSVPATKTRIEKLTENGIIENFTINIDYSLLTEGKPLVIALRVPLRYTDEVANRIYNMKYVKQIFFTTGKYNLLLFTHFISDTEKGKLLDSIKSMEEIEDIEVLFLFNELLEKQEFQIENPTNSKIICDYCKREFTGTVFTKVIGNRKRYFCCNTCLSEFEKAFSKNNSS